MLMLALISPERSRGILVRFFSALRSGRERMLRIGGHTLSGRGMLHAFGIIVVSLPILIRERHLVAQVGRHAHPANSTIRPSTLEGRTE